MRPLVRHHLLAALAAVEDQRPFVIGEDRDAALVRIVMQVRPAEPDMPQNAAESLREVGLGEDLRGRTVTEDGLVEEHDLIAIVGHRAEIVRGDQHQAAASLSSSRMAMIAASASRRRR